MNTSSFFKYNEFKCAPLPHMFLMWASHWSGFMIFNEKGKYVLHKCALHTTHIQPIMMPSCHQMYSHPKMWMTNVENVKHDVLPSCRQMYSHHKMWMTNVENVKHDMLYSQLFHTPQLTFTYVLFCMCTGIKLVSNMLVNEIKILCWLSILFLVGR